MAYLQPQDDEEKQADKIQAQAPGAVASGSSGGMVQGGMSGALAPQQTPQQQAGSGNFTNLKSWLDAGKGRDQNISTTGNKLLGGEQATFNNAAQPLRDATFNPLELSDTQVNDILFDTTPDAQAPTFSGSSGSGGGAGAGAFGLPSGGGNPNASPGTLAGGIGALKDWLNPNYKGPHEVKYDFGNKGLRSLDNLSGLKTVGAELAGETPYSSGARRLDNALFGSDADSLKAIDTNKTQGTKFITDSTKEVKDLVAKAEGFDEQARKAAAERHAKLEEIAGNIGADVQGRVNAANAADLIEKNRLNDAIDNRTQRTVQEGTGATAENQITESEAAALQRLGELVGAKTINRTGGYMPWKVTDTAAPDPRQDYIDAVQNPDVPYVNPDTGLARDPTEKATSTTNDIGWKYDLNNTITSGNYDQVRDDAGNWIGFKDKDTGQVLTMEDMKSGNYVFDGNTKKWKKKGG